MHRAYRLARNCFCGLLALGLIVSGRVRRARNRAFSGDVITAIYFHKPNRRLFGQCIQWLTKHGYTFVSANDLVQILRHGKTPPKGGVWLSFDDGYKDLLDNVLPSALKHRIPVTFFIPSGIVNGDGLLPWEQHRKTPGAPNNAEPLAHNEIRDVLTLAELKQVADLPEVTIGSHTVNHTVTTGLTRDELRFELGESQHVLESWTHAGINCFAYPVGRFDGGETVTLAEFGYALAATTENAFISRDTDPYSVPRFSIGDEISLPEAICNMVGVWRPAIDPLIHVVRRLGGIVKSPGYVPQDIRNSRQSA